MNSINNFISYLPDRTSQSIAGMIVVDDATGIDEAALNAKNWNVVLASTEVVVAEYKFDKRLADLIPDFNTEFNSYIVHDSYVDIEDLVVPEYVNYEYVSDVTIPAEFIVTRKIVSYGGELPTLMRFGSTKPSGGDYTKQLALLKVLDLTTTNLTDTSLMFFPCRRLVSVDINNWDTSNVTLVWAMFSGCNALPSINMTGFDVTR